MHIFRLSILMLCCCFLFGLAQNTDQLKKSSLWKNPQVQKLYHLIQINGVNSQHFTLIQFPEDTWKPIDPELKNLTLKRLKFDPQYDALLSFISQYHPKGFLPIIKDPHNDQYYMITNVYGIGIIEYFEYIQNNSRDQVPNLQLQIQELEKYFQLFKIPINWDTQQIFIHTKSGEIIINILLFFHGTQKDVSIETDQFSYHGFLKPIQIKDESYDLIKILSYEARNRVYLVRQQKTQKLMILKFSHTNNIHDEIPLLKLFDEYYDSLIIFPQSDEKRRYILLSKFFPGQISSHLEPFYNLHSDITQLAQNHRLSRSRFRYELLKRINNLDKKQQKLLLEIANKLVGHLLELHQKGFVHGDIKPTNIIVNTEIDNTLTHLFDYELSFDPSDKDTLTNVYGTYVYFSPEMFSKQQTDSLRRKLLNRGSFSRDWYALGKTLFEILTGLPGFAYPDLLTHPLLSTFASNFIDFDLMQDIINELQLIPELNSLFEALATIDPSDRNHKVKLWYQKNNNPALSISA